MWNYVFISLGKHSVWILNHFKVRNAWLMRLWAVTAQVNLDNYPIKLSCQALPRPVGRFPKCKCAISCEETKRWGRIKKRKTY